VTKRLMVAFATGAVGLVLWTGTGSAEPSGLRPPYGPPPDTAGPQVGDCPTSGGWILVTPSGPGHLSAAYDFNYDNQVCARFLPWGGFALMDNVIPD